MQQAHAIYLLGFVYQISRLIKNETSECPNPQIKTQS
jgi:hypothetical protein